MEKAYRLSTVLATRTIAGTANGCCGRFKSGFSQSIALRRKTAESIRPNQG
jgi:hypothetical protein